MVIPAYNHARFLGEAIKSVFDQDYQPLEVIVVNDGSTDDTREVVALFPSVVHLEQANRGLAQARNVGVARSKGEMVVFLDADDRLLAGAIRAGADLLAADSSLAFAAGYSRFIAADGTPQATNQPQRPGGDPYVALLRRNSIRNPAMVMFRREVLMTTGGFDPDVNACADYELYLRISRQYRVVFHDAVVADYRKHGDNMSDNSGLMLRELAKVMRRQRPYLDTAARRQAFSEGLQNARSYYGDRVVNQIRARLGERTGWGETVGDLATLLRCHPAGLIEHALRKFRLLRKGRP